MARIEYKTNMGNHGAIDIDLRPWERKGKDAFLRDTKPTYVKALCPSISEGKLTELLNTMWDVAYPPKTEPKRAEAEQK